MPKLPPTFTILPPSHSSGTAVPEPQFSLTAEGLTVHVPMASLLACEGKVWNRKNGDPGGVTVAQAGGRFGALDAGGIRLADGTARSIAFRFSADVLNKA